MKKILIILMIIFVGSFLIGAAPAIYPGINEIRLEDGRGQGSFILFNQEDQVKKYKVTVRDVDNDGEKSELSEYLKAFPRYLEIEPGQNKTVRLLIRNFPGNVEGEYRASISIEELASDLEQTHRTKETVVDGITTSIEYKYTINTAVYGYIGELVNSIEIDLEENGKGVLKGVIENTGNYSYPLSAKFLGEKEEMIQEGTLGKVMDNGDLDLNLEVPESSRVLEISHSKTGEVLYRVDIKG